jgi:hypothetical protein
VDVVEVVVEVVDRLIMDLQEGLPGGPRVAKILQGSKVAYKQLTHHAALPQAHARASYYPTKA